MGLQQTRNRIWNYRLIGVPLVIVTTPLMIGAALSTLREAAFRPDADKLSQHFGEKIAGHNPESLLNKLCDISPLPNTAELVTFHNIYFATVAVGFTLGAWLIGKSVRLAKKIKQACDDVDDENLREDIRRRRT